MGWGTKMGTSVKSKENLAISSSELAKQWHPAKNNDLTPAGVTLGSGKKVWWKCEQGHEWEARIYDRSRGQDCPFCTGLKVMNPDLAKQWHPIKNSIVRPDKIKLGSPKKAWWKCEQGHEWEATISSRANGIGCPFCSGKRASVENNLQVLNPELAKQWHSFKNGGLTPSNVTAGSSKKIWWMCEKGHSWKVTIAHRSNGTGCPFCSGKRASVENNLQVLNPELAKQWHPTKNENLFPSDVTVRSNKKVWWQCEKGHEWEALISNRSKGVGCPECNKETQTSFPEQAIYFYMKNIFSDTLNRYKYDGKWEIDVFVPSLNFGIEYDGYRYHDESEFRDIEKERYITNSGVIFLRIKEVCSQKRQCYLLKLAICKTIA